MDPGLCGGAIRGGKKRIRRRGRDKRQERIRDRRGWNKKRRGDIIIKWQE